MARGRRKFKAPVLASPGQVEIPPAEEVAGTPTPPDEEHGMSVSSPSITEIKMEVSDPETTKEDEKSPIKVTDKRKTRGGQRASVTVKKEKGASADEELESNSLDPTSLDTFQIPPPIPTDLDPDADLPVETEDIKDNLVAGMGRFPESVVAGILTIDMSSLHVSELFPETSVADQNFDNFTIEENNFTIAADPNEPPFSPAKKGRRKYTTRGGAASKRGRTPGVGGRGKRRAEPSSPFGAGDAVPKVRKPPVKRGRKAKDFTDPNGGSSFTTFAPSKTVNKPFEGRLYRSSDLDCFEPSEEMDPADLIGFEHIDVFRAADYLTGHAAGKNSRGGGGQVSGGAYGANNPKISPISAQGLGSCPINTCEVADELMKEAGDELMKEVVADLKRLDTLKVEETQKLATEL